MCLYAATWIYKNTQFNLSQTEIKNNGILCLADKMFYFLDDL